MVVWPSVRPHAALSGRMEGAAGLPPLPEVRAYKEEMIDERER